MKNLEIKALFVLVSNHFRKSFSINAGVLLRMENGFSGKEFQLSVKLRPLTWKIFSAKILPSNHFLRRAKRERERERTHTRKQREKERSQTQKSGDRRTTGEIVNPRLSNPRTASCTNPRTTNGEPTSPRTANPQTHKQRTHEQQTHEPTIESRTHEQRVTPRQSHRRVAPLPISFSFLTQSSSASPISLSRSHRTNDLVVVSLSLKF